ncbi:MAG: phosphoglucomutase/phosphomannomutase, C-terminal domain protein, partial [Acidimicrobiales bacterium]|nr:phosphoglucomutase/phosphomannomutase, C-terminal domain protein [Acidimicrobiales bacterium]
MDATMTAEELRQHAEEWLADDPDPATRSELQALLARVDEGDPAAAADLVDRFSAPLEFGTAGLRGALGAGPNRMNLAVVVRAAAALAAWVRSGDPDAGRRGVAVGFDARHRS